MLRRAMPALLGLLLVLSGCLGGTELDATASDDEAEPGVVIDPDRPIERLGDVVTGPAVGPDLNATTAEPPRLVEGEWWRIAFRGTLGQGDVEVVRVVADAHEEGYVMGMPHEGWLKEAIAFHSPAFGDIGLDLSYDTHNVKFEPVRFPLVEGATWETAFAASPMIAEVVEADEHTAVITYTFVEGEPQPTDPLLALLVDLGGGEMVATYDARTHEIVHMDTGFGEWAVLEHGYDFEGWVTVPRGEHTAIDYGTFGPTSEAHDPLPRTIQVTGGFNRMTMMHLVFPITPGVYKIKDIAPDEQVFETNATDALVLRFYESATPDGTWTVQDIVGGAGATYSMGIAYHQYDIRLPDGLRRADHAHHVIR